MNDPNIDGYNAAAMQGRFGMSSIPFHTHNGTNSPLAYQPIVTYVGYVRSDGVVKTTTIAQVSSGIFPAPWTITHTALSGVYKITHNLGTFLYEVACTAEGINLTVALTTKDKNFTTFSTGIITTGVAQSDAPFRFILTVVANSTPFSPSYVYIQ